MTIPVTKRYTCFEDLQHYGMPMVVVDSWKDLTPKLLRRVRLVTANELCSGLPTEWLCLLAAKSGAAWIIDRPGNTIVQCWRGHDGSEQYKASSPCTTAGVQMHDNGDRSCHAALDCPIARCGCRIRSMFVARCWVVDPTRHNSSTCNSVHGLMPPISYS
eukprot:scaffold911_cov361-Prasinococcus_capsulatus_cf.AAC.16